MGSRQKATLTPTPVPVSNTSKAIKGVEFSSPMNQPDANDSVPTISFTNIDDLLREIANAPGDALVVTNVSPMDFEMLIENYEISPIKYRLSLYTANSQCLWVTIPDASHESLHIDLYWIVGEKISEMGLSRSWRHKAATTFKSTGPYFGSGGGDGGEGDSSGGPKPERLLNEAFPTLVIEAGYSQTLEELRLKARSWFSRSRHDVKVVILAKLNLAERTITLERWEERQRGRQPHGGAITRWAAEWIPGCQQVITISMISENPLVFRVTSSDLVLDFRLLFLRDPHPGEGDVIITIAELQNYAQELWGGRGYI